MTGIGDLLQREIALNPARSFIVQAPAGSGKTELLTQRFLNLLAHSAQSPEEIIAITFTRKAAAEMRFRILSALTEGTTPAAVLARARDQQLGWRLMENANRLSIMTIDALCHTLVRRAPMRSNSGLSFKIHEDPLSLYTKAVQNLLLFHAEEAEFSEAIRHLLWHMDNDVTRFTNLCVDILAHRDQWLPHIFELDAIDRLEEGLANIITEQLHKCRDAIPPHCREELLSLITFAAQHSPHPSLQSCRDLICFPSTMLSDRDAWLAIAQLFVTKEGSKRKKFTVNEGFPSPSSAKTKEDKLRFTDYKQRLQACLSRLETEETFYTSLADLLATPPPYYQEDQKNIIKALTKALPLLVAELQLLFSEEKQVDFVEMTLRALQALGDTENPTDLALTFDYQLRHLLIDEFQDTSLTQLRLIEKLIAGWDGQDGRTLFLVGDPMQSIYRFRKAEVGLFLQVQQQGIGQVSLASLTLSTNFRATPSLVDWHNHHFSRIFPLHSDASLGAICYSPSQPLSYENHEQGTQVHYVNDDVAEAEQVVTILKQTWAANPQATVAILVRARQHLREILPALQQAQIPYRMVGMATLQDEPIIQDLFSLTRALVHPADRIAWLAILRAPWCGLTLEDLHALAGHDHHETIWTLLHQIDLSSLTPDGQKRYLHFMQAMVWAMAQTGRFSLGKWVEETWKKLQGPACLLKADELRHAETYFRLLYRLPLNVKIDSIEKHLAKLTLPVNSDSNIRLDIMTIHKSKGLEFDVILLPGLHKVTRQSQSRLFLWTERINASGHSDLLLAPVKAAGEKFDGLYAYLKKEEEKKMYYESQRLLYVAATRSKKMIHWLLPSAISSPENNTLLAQLWPVMEIDNTLQQAAPHTSPIPQSHRVDSLPLKRISTEMLSFHLPQDKPFSTAYKSSDNRQVLQDLQSSKEDYLLLLLPELLQKAAAIDMKADEKKQQTAWEPWIKNRLLQLGWPMISIQEGLTMALLYLNNCLSDERSRWLFRTDHQDMREAVNLTSAIKGRLVHFTLDRTFVDKDQRRWIISYQRHGQYDKAQAQAQLERIATLFFMSTPFPIHLGLYFPLERDWIEWPLKFYTQRGFI